MHPPFTRICGKDASGTGLALRNLFDYDIRLAFCQFRDRAIANLDLSATSFGKPDSDKERLPGHLTGRIIVYEHTAWSILCNPDVWLLGANCTMAAKAATAFHDTLFNENSARDSPSQSFNSEKDDLEKTQDLDDPNLNTEDLVDIEEESPYPEVRSAVANADDVDMPCSTLRAWVIGLAFAILIPGLNQFFFFRFPSVTITAIVGQLISFPIGRFAAATLPRKKIFGISLNP
ncbi:opt oligopeptide transporter, partial [Moniliophthora roreri]